MTLDLTNLDTVLLEEVLGHIHNWFARESISASIEISNNALPDDIANKLISGQWYRIEGSYLNDGLHCHVASDLEDESFIGSITLLAIPKPLLKLVLDIQSWIDANQSAQNGPYASESFGGYSYTLKSDLSGSSASDGLTGWRLAFRDRLNQWRKMY